MILNIQIIFEIIVNQKSFPSVSKLIKINTSFKKIENYLVIKFKKNVYPKITINFESLQK